MTDRYWKETECEECGMRPGVNPHLGAGYPLLCQGSGGSRTELFPATPNYEAAQELMDSILATFNIDPDKQGLIIDTGHLIDAGLVGVVLLQETDQ